MNFLHLSNVTPIDGGEIVVFCVAMAAVIIEVVMTVDCRQRDFVVVVTGSDFMMLALTSGCFCFGSFEMIAG